MTDLKNMIVFISGASSGIGKACAEAFAKQGANLILCARNINKLNLVAETLQNEYETDITTYQLDVRKRKEVKELIAKLPPKWKNIDILVNNAGLAAGLEKVQDGDIDDWEQMIDTNIKGLLYLTRQIVPTMIERKVAGHIINIGSIAGNYAYPNGGVYCGTKAAVRLISDGLRMDLVDTPIRVTNIQPGLVETNFSVVRFHGDEAKAKDVYKGIKALTGTDIADIVVYSAAAPKHVQICEVTVTPTNQASGTVVYRDL